MQQRLVGVNDVPASAAVAKGPLAEAMALARAGRLGAVLGVTSTGVARHLAGAFEVR